ncbi:hypothetical protein QQF64_002950 [Cirrhinus molitorella]|uniref:Uncharacterized protein n=1 Tax=Cirrhinus molitorella TaxID=172907 RepID=A0ABR3MIR2_9TELE
MVLHCNRYLKEKQPIAGLSRGLYCCPLVLMLLPGQQPFPGGLVVRIRRSHRRGPGSIPARLLAKNGFRRRKTCGSFEEGSKEEPAFPYRESNPGRLVRRVIHCATGPPPGAPRACTRLDQPFPGGLVVRIRRSHRRGPGSIPGQGTLFCPPMADCKVELCLPFREGRPPPKKRVGT